MRRIMYFVATAGYNKQEQERRLAEMAPFLPEGYEIVFNKAKGGPEFLDKAEDFGKAISAASAQIGDVTFEDCDALISGGAIDPGVALMRQAAKVPVIAPGEASLFIASLAGLPTSLVTVDEHAVSNSHKFLAATPVKPKIVSIRNMETPVRKIVSNLDAGRAALLREVKAAIEEDGAQAIYLACMTLSTLGMTNQLRRDFRVPIYDPLDIAIRTAVQVIVSRLGDGQA